MKEGQQDPLLDTEQVARPCAQNNPVIEFKPEQECCAWQLLLCNRSDLQRYKAPSSLSAGSQVHRSCEHTLPPLLPSTLWLFCLPDTQKVRGADLPVLAQASVAKLGLTERE